MAMAALAEQHRQSSPTWEDGLMDMFKLGSLAALAAAAVLAAGCGSGASTTGGGTSTVASTATIAPSGGDPVSDGTFTLALGAKPDTLDPQKTLIDASLAVFQYTYDYLVTVDADGKLAPGIAERWTQTPKQVTFTLKDGVTCVDGSAVTATTVKRNLDSVKDPKLQSSLLGIVVPDAQYSVTADDAARTVTIRLAKPFGLLVPSLQLLPIVCGSGLEDRSGLTKGASGSGPYKMTEAVPGDHYTLTRRDGYTWGPAGGTTATAGMPANVQLRVVANPTTTANLMLSGEVSAAPLNGAEAKRLTGAGLRSARFPATSAFTFYNEAAGHPGADATVRRALTMAIPRAELAKVLYNGSSPVARGILSSKLACDDASLGGGVPSGSVEAAAALLDQAGWKAGPDGVRVKGGKRLELTAPYANDLAGYGAGVELLATTWKQLGVALKPKPMAADAAVGAAFTDAWDVLPVFEVGVNLPSQFVPFVSGPAPKQGQNFPHVANARYTTLAKQALARTAAAGCGLWLAAERTLVSRADVVPLVAVQSTYFASKTTTFAINLFGPIPITIRLSGS
jgi:peptide/nickel transport system substrate-binding protein